MIHGSAELCEKGLTLAGHGDEGAKPMDQLINTRDIVEMFQLTPYTVNYYTNIGLLRVIVKQKNRRLYGHLETAERMERISNFSKNGYPLLLIRKLINDPNGELKRGTEV